MNYSEQSNSKGLRDAANRIKDKISQWADSARRVVSNIAGRVSNLWTRAHEGVYATGQTRDREDNWYMWEIGATEKHCKDCLHFNGQIHTATEWASAGVRPQDPSLACGGWNCDCRLKAIPGYTGNGVGNIGFGE